MNYKAHIVELVKLEGLEENDVIVAQDATLADFAIPCFKFAKILKKSPMILASELAQSIKKSNYIAEITAVNGYLNFKVNREFFVEKVLNEVLSENENFGKSDIGAGKTICIDYSSINIAKPFHIGHLSTTVIGAAIYRMHKHLGYNVVGINHLGDWGTQFGKLIVAYKKWGNEQDVNNRKIKALLEIYVKFHEEAEKHPELEKEARFWFKKIEEGNNDAMQLFNWFKKVTLDEVQKVYEMLDVHFDSYDGESFYNDKMQPIIDELKEKKILKKSDDAMVVDLEEFSMPPCLLVKGDGATLYATRDLAAAEYRKKTYDFHKCLYVVAYQQNLHFKQIFKVLELMGRDYAKDMVHVAFGMVSLEGQGSLSTRKGNVVFLEDVISKCIEKAEQIICEKNPNLENKQEIAKTVGLGAVVFSALHANRIKDIVFSYDKVLNFEGETAPYVQYTFARCNSVMEKAKITTLTNYLNISDVEFELVKLIESFKNTLIDACERYEPSMVTRLMIDIAKTYNKFYFEHRILGDNEETQNFRLKLTKATMTTLKIGSELLGIKVPLKM